MISTPRRLTAIASAIGALAIGTPVTAAYAGNAPAPSAGAAPTFTLPTFNLPTFNLPALPALVMPSGPLGAGLNFTPPAGLNFTPPKVGPIGVDIGAIIIDGKVINPALHVQTPGATVPLAAAP
jgi:hypothetical protein